MDIDSYGNIVGYDISRLFGVGVNMHQGFLVRLGEISSDHWKNPTFHIFLNADFTDSIFLIFTFISFSLILFALSSTEHADHNKAMFQKLEVF